MFSNLLNLFISFFKVGLLSFGGAYSLVPIIESEVVRNNHWLNQDEFLQILGIVQVIPGAISIKFATYTGFKVAGIFGAIVANIGNLLFPAFLIIVVYFAYDAFHKNIYFKQILTGIKYAVIGMVIMIMFRYLFQKELNYKTIIFVIVGAGLTFFEIHPAYIVLIIGILAFLL